MTDRRGHIIEAYIEIPEHNIYSSYGITVIRKVEKFTDCWRKEMPSEIDDINAALLEALRQAMADWAEQTKVADHYEIRVESKYGPPYWTLSVRGDG